MNKANKYDPEDIESLLLNKSFAELYPEEREFVLKFLDGEHEYESLRKTLSDIKSSQNTDNWLDPDPSIKSNLMEQLAQERRGRFGIWLNSLFVMPDVRWYKRPAYQLSFAMAVVLIGTFIYLANSSDEPTFAENKNKMVNDSLDVVKNEADSNATFNSVDTTLYAATQTKELPAAPSPVSDMAVISETTTREGAAALRAEASNNKDELETAMDAKSNKIAAEQTTSGAINDVAISSAPQAAEKMSTKSFETNAPAETDQLQTLSKTTVTPIPKQLAGIATNVPASASLKAVDDLLSILFTAQ